MMFTLHIHMIKGGCRAINVCVIITYPKYRTDEVFVANGRKANDRQFGFLMVARANARNADGECQMDHHQTNTVN